MRRCIISSSKSAWPCAHWHVCSDTSCLCPPFCTRSPVLCANSLRSTFTRLLVPCESTMASRSVLPTLKTRVTEHLRPVSRLRSRWWVLWWWRSVWRVCLSSELLDLEVVFVRTNEMSKIKLFWYRKRKCIFLRFK